MMPPLRRHVSFANITSVMALMIALGGTSYAAIKIPKNSVGSAQIKKGAVASSDLKANAVGAASVKNGSLLAADFAPGQLPTGPRGPQGAPGTPGLQGLPGIQGVTGVVGAITVQRTDIDLPNNGVATAALASCPEGTKIIGGGATIADAGSKDVAVAVSRPYLTGASSGCRTTARASTAGARCSSTPASRGSGVRRRRRRDHRALLRDLAAT